MPDVTIAPETRAWRLYVSRGGLLRGKHEHTDMRRVSRYLLDRATRGQRIAIIRGPLLGSHDDDLDWGNHLYVTIRYDYYVLPEGAPDIEFEGDSVRIAMQPGVGGGGGSGVRYAGWHDGAVPPGGRGW